jgi:hypothetical protein
VSKPRDQCLVCGAGQSEDWISTASGSVLCGHFCELVHRLKLRPPDREGPEPANARAPTAEDGRRCDGCGLSVRSPGGGAAGQHSLCRDCEEELAAIEETPDPRVTWGPDDGNPPGMPRPIHTMPGRRPARPYPLPWVFDWDETSAGAGPEYVGVSPTRLDEAWENLYCILCGEDLADPVYFFEDGDSIGQGGLHRRCARLTEAHCPGIPGAWDPARTSLAEWERLTRETAPDATRGAELPSDFDYESRAGKTWPT